MIDLEKIVSQAEAVAREAGSFISREARGFSSAMARGKGINDFVSYVDIESEKLIVERLRELLPEAGFIVEENTTSAGEKEYMWVIDPLDGTTNFIHKLPPYSVSIGLMRGSEPVGGVVYVITSDEMFSARKGGGAFLNGQAIKVSETSSIKDMLVGTGFPFKDYSRLDGYLETLEYFIRNTHGVRRMGSAAVDLAYLACGRFDSFFEYNLNPWDVTAGIVLIREAGGKVSTFGGDELHVSGREIVATNGTIHDRFLQIVSGFMTEKPGR